MYAPRESAPSARQASGYEQAPPELADAMDLAYLTGQRPADVLNMSSLDIKGTFLAVQQNKTSKRLRITLEVDGVKNSLGLLIERIMARTAKHPSSYFILNSWGQKLSSQMLRNRWAEARELAKLKAIKEGRIDEAEKIANFLFKDIRPKAASEILDLGDASRLLGHSKQGITERVYRRVGAIANPTK